MRPFTLIILCTLALGWLGTSYVDSSAQRGGQTTEWLVTNAANGSLLPTYPGRRAIELQNLGPNAIYCTVGESIVGATAIYPLATGALGRRIDAAGGTWTLDVGPSVRIRCIAAAAAQLTTAATQVTELR